MTLKPFEDSLFKQLPIEVRDALKLSGVVPVADPILPLWNIPKGTTTIVLIGGRGGMKTWGVSDYAANQCAAYKKRAIVLRDEKSRIKESILNEILERFDDIPYQHDVEKLTTGLKYKDQEILFTKGFKASDNTKKANMKGASGIDIAIIEEAEDITDETKFNTFIDSLRKEGCIVIILMNTPDIGHFLLKRYFETNIPAPVPANCPLQMINEYEGFFDVVPKNVPGVVCIKTGFEDNPYLPVHIVNRYKAYGDPESHLYNPHYYLSSIKGYASTGRKGQVHKKVKPITLHEYLALPFKEYYGQDFGTAAPAGFVGVKFNKNNIYTREINYKPMNGLEIGKLYCTMNLTNADPVIADNADSIWKKLRNGFPRHELSDEDIQKYPKLLSGFNVIPCDKSAGLKAGIDLLDGMNWFAVGDNLWEEIKNRIYAKDKNDNYTNEPEPGFDHLIDPIVYVAVRYRGKKKFEITTGNNHAVQTEKPYGYR